ncbi:MAG: hypothetical protein M3Z19_12400 [Chloroflexota bacterium]|nr:hypothetical protein [Chloroflexota bacterium]
MATEGNRAGVLPLRPAKDARRLAPQSAGVWCAIGALILIGGGIAEAVLPAVRQRGTRGFLCIEMFWTISYVLLLLGVLGLARSDATGDSRLGKLGLGVALLGRLLFIMVEITLLTPFNSPQTLLGLAAPLTGLGMLLAGIAVVRARRWGGWQRFAPLSCGVYVFVVLLPTFAIARGPNFLALGGWGLCWLLLGVALRDEATRASSRARRVDGGRR